VKIIKPIALRYFGNANILPMMDQPYYSGKELISTCLPTNINYDSHTKWFEEKLSPYIHYTEDEKAIKVRHGQLISGVADKAFSDIFSSIYSKYSATKAMESLFNY
jgi:DNA-directed RNA polymerase II subunit RPB1